jgi:2'-5' RNA ligase
MRAFVAIGLPPQVQDDLDAALGPVGQRLPGLRLTPRVRRHLTLVFLGQVGQRQRGELADRLRRAAARSPRLTLRLEGGGSFGRRVAWVGLAGDRAGLGRLAARTAAAARRSGIAVEDRPYRPHVSVARGSSRADEAGLEAAASALAAFRGRSWTVTSIDLVRSVQGPRPLHQVLATFPLRPDDDRSYQA